MKRPVPDNFVGEAQVVGGAVQELFRSAVARRQECPPLKIVSMLTALKKLQVQLSQERDWLSIRMHVRSASLDDLAGFCRAAQEADVVVHRVVALELARAASRAAAAEGSDAAQVAAVRAAVHGLAYQCAPSCSELFTTGAMQRPAW